MVCPGGGRSWDVALSYYFEPLSCEMAGSPFKPGDERTCFSNENLWGAIEKKGEMAYNKA